jgi:hypothetical protein
MAPFCYLTCRVSPSDSSPIHRVKIIVYGKVQPYTGTKALYRPTAHRGSRGTALLLLDHGTRRGWGVSVTPRPLFTPGKDPAPIVQEAGWAPGPIRTGAENLAPTGIRSPDRPARSQSLYRLRYPAHWKLSWQKCTYPTLQTEYCCVSRTVPLHNVVALYD